MRGVVHRAVGTGGEVGDLAGAGVREVTGQDDGGDGRDGDNAGKADPA
ncbi:MAG TPA: hypothetical protein VFT95_09825 [Micromonosporaceae bacterium]|nr:hypothetical protein [Micromonosporaceae bacterium]